MGIDEAWEGQSRRPIAPPIRGRRAISGARERSVTISGELDEENYRAYLSYSDKEYCFGSPEATDDSHSLDLTLTKGLSYPYPVYMHTCSNRYILRRTLSDIRKKPAKTCILSIILKGDLNIRQGGRSMKMSSNQLTLIDLTEPYMIDILPPADEEFESIFTYLPSHTISKHICPYMPHVLDMNRNEVSAISALLYTLFDHGAYLPHYSCQAIFDAILFRINSGNKINGPVDMGKQGIVTSDDDRWHQVVSYIHLMYSNNLLDAVSVAREIGVSQRSLNYLFAQNGTTFSKILWDLRLSVVRDWLSDPSMREVTIQKMASDAGFKSAAHLSTFFRSRMKCSPREFRMRMARC